MQSYLSVLSPADTSTNLKCNSLSLGQYCLPTCLPPSIPPSVVPFLPSCPPACPAACMATAAAPVSILETATIWLMPVHSNPPHISVYRAHKQLLQGAIQSNLAGSLCQCCAHLTTPETRCTNGPILLSFSIETPAMSKNNKNTAGALHISRAQMRKPLNRFGMILQPCLSKGCCSMQSK